MERVNYVFVKFPIIILKRNQPEFRRLLAFVTTMTSLFEARQLYLYKNQAFKNERDNFVAYLIKFYRRRVTDYNTSRIDQSNRYFSSERVNFPNCRWIRYFDTSDKRSGNDLVSNVDRVSGKYLIIRIFSKFFFFSFFDQLTSKIFLACLNLPHSKNEIIKSYRELISPWISVLRSVRRCNWSAFSVSIHRLANSVLNGVARYLVQQFSNSFRALSKSSLKIECSIAS